MLYLVDLSVDSMLLIAMVSWLHFALTILKYAQIRTVAGVHSGGGRLGGSEGKFRLGVAMGGNECALAVYFFRPRGSLQGLSVIGAAARLATSEFGQTVDRLRHL